MADIQVNTPAGPIDAVLETPSGEVGSEQKWPGVVIVHDVFGLSPDIRNIARRFADKGYVALAPDLYTRGGARKCVAGVFRALLGQSGVAVDDLLAAREFLAAQENVTGKVGIVGFCMGGGFALLLSPNGFDASAPFYGITPKKVDEVLGGACPIVASYGKNDPSLIGAGKKIEKVLSAKGIAHDVKTYPGASHGFANALPEGIAGKLVKITGMGWRGKQAEDAFGRVFSFFETHLR
ncbi:dienelactone hydrolase family protein [Rhodococcus sp. G-MC3]|uniref:dienelactone hydrolase family protein n=1 Tax=Rhodococcus sp. G-MC3 TaxID=3046209 RepID=UPI0024BB9A9E|nr:dienelactone hydrolase family protein [Rhodococcus sp. G-MC3]MDJ0392554.1 dienelactone hydrolase family protein [Rhodococcus sp. G-MC3]